MENLNSPLSKSDFSKIDRYIDENKKLFNKSFSGFVDFKLKYLELNKLCINLNDKERERVLLYIYSKIDKIRKNQTWKNTNASNNSNVQGSSLSGHAKDKIYIGIFVIVIVSFITFITYALIQHKKSNERKEIMKIETVNRKGKFISIHECLAYVEMDIPLEKIYIDNTPTLVWGGFKGSDGSFRCEIVATGTQGVYVQGSYNVPITALRQNVKK